MSFACTNHQRKGISYAQLHLQYDIERTMPQRNLPNTAFCAAMLRRETRAFAERHGAVEQKGIYAAENAIAFEF